jgi:hypothetical protein
METPKLDESQLSIMRRYPLETLITALFVCVTVLSGVVYSNNKQIEELHDRVEVYFKEDSQMMLKALQQNTDALNRFSQKADK